MVIREQPFIQLFSSKEYSLFWLAALFSNIGMWALIYGRLWLMRTMTDSETLLGLVSSANLMPVLLFSIFGGVIADKYNRLKILQTTRLFFALVTLLTGLLIFNNNMNPAILIIISIITGCLLAIDIPSRASMIAKLVKKEYLAVGISMYSIVFGVSGIIGPSLSYCPKIWFRRIIFYHRNILCFDLFYAYKNECLYTFSAKRVDKFNTKRE